MKIKNVFIGIKSVEDVLKDAQNTLEKIERGEKVKKKNAGVYFENLEVMRKAITSERLRVLKMIKEKHPLSIYGLAKLLDRNLKNVSDDVHYLAELGLIELERDKSNGRDKTMPIVNYDKILLEIAV